MIRGKLLHHWRLNLTRFAGPRWWGRIAARLAAWKTVPYHGQDFLAKYHSHGFVAATAVLDHPDLRLGKHVFIGDGVVLWRREEGGPVELHDGVALYGNTFIQTGRNGKVTIGAETHIQPGGTILAHVGDITIGRNVEIAAGCAFYPYDHGVEAGKLIMDQPLQSKGPITVGDGAWLGHGVTVLSGVRIGKGAVIGAGSVVIRDIPDEAIAAGVPAKVIRHRGEISPGPAITPVVEEQIR